MHKHLYKLFVSIAIFTLLLCSTSKGHSQSRDSLLSIYNSQTIHTLGKVYVKGSKQLSFWDLKPEFQSGLITILYKKSKGHLILSRVLTVTSVAALVTSAVIKKNNKGAALGLTIGGIALNLGSIHFRKQSTELLERTLWIRNKEVLFGTQ